MLHEKIEQALKKSAYQNELKEIMEYAVFPAGKLFRPKLIEALSLDLGHSTTEDHFHLAAALELHHAYTLVHDDLPSMDNDLIRRGKPSTHAQFGEWKAILAGDALLIASFHELHQIKHPRAMDIFKLMSWATGAKGLILGQFLDLSSSGTLSLKETIRIHELKTARLLQMGTLGTYFLKKEALTLKGKVKYFRFGKELGVSFQLLDDLTDLTDKEISAHEKMINPFILNPEMALEKLKISYLKLKQILDEEKLAETSKMLNDYFKKMKETLIKGFFQIEEKFEMKFWLDDLKKWTETL